MDDDTPVSIRRGSLNMREQDEAESLGSASNQGYLGLICPVDLSMEEDEPMQICGRGNDVSEANAMGTKMMAGMNCQVQAGPAQQPVHQHRHPALSSCWGRFMFHTPPVQESTTGATICVRGGCQWRTISTRSLGLTQQLRSRCIALFGGQGGDFQNCSGHHTTELPDHPKVP
jgi:hypothetical protein